MHWNHTGLIAASAILIQIAGCANTSAQAPSAPSLADQLKAQYKVTKVSEDSNGLAIIEAGTVLSIQKGGILGVPPSNLTMAPSVYKEGDLHPPGVGGRMLVGKDTRFLQVGAKVYLRKLDVNLKADKVSCLIFECDSCNGATQPSSYKSVVIFQFPKGSLDTGDIGPIQDAIAKVFSVEGGAPSFGGISKTQGGITPGPGGSTQPASLGSVYVNSQNSNDKLQLSANGSFSLVESAQSFNGTYSLIGSTLRLRISQLQKDVDIPVQGNQLLVNGSETWIQPN